MTSTPAWTVAINALKITCLPPVLAMTSDWEYSSWFSRRNFSRIAALRSAAPPISVYFVRDAASARMTASITLGAVSKSGSPAVSPTTSWPSAFKARERCVAIELGEGLIRLSRSAISCILLSSVGYSKLRTAPLTAASKAVATKVAACKAAACKGHIKPPFAINLAPAARGQARLRTIAL